MLSRQPHTLCHCPFIQSAPPLRHRAAVVRDETRRHRRGEARQSCTGHTAQDTGHLRTETPITKAPPHSSESGVDHQVSSQCSILHHRIGCREASDSSASSPCASVHHPARTNSCSSWPTQQTCLPACLPATARNTASSSVGNTYLYEGSFLPWGLACSACVTAQQHARARLSGHSWVPTAGCSVPRIPGPSPPSQKPGQTGLPAATSRTTPLPSPPPHPRRQLVQIPRSLPAIRTSKTTRRRGRPTSTRYLLKPRAVSHPSNPYCIVGIVSHRPPTHAE